MLAKVKMAKRISTTVFDPELLDLIAAAIADLKLIGIEFDVTETKTQGVVTDYTITDPLISRAITTTRSVAMPARIFQFFISRLLPFSWFAVC